MPDVYDQRQVPIAVVSVMFSDEHQLPAISVITDQCQVSALMPGTSDQCHYLSVSGVDDHCRYQRSVSLLISVSCRRSCQVPVIRVITDQCQVLMIIAGTSDQWHY